MSEHVCLIVPIFPCPVTEALLLDGNKNLTGDVTSICQSLDDLQIFRVDCGGKTPNVDPDVSVVCSCSSCICCDEANTTDCNYEELAEYDPTWETGYRREGFYEFLDRNLTRV